MDAQEKLFPESVNILESGLESSLQFYHFEKIDARKIASIIG